MTGRAGMYVRRQVERVRAGRGLGNCGCNAVHYDCLLAWQLASQQVVSQQAKQMLSPACLMQVYGWGRQALSLFAGGAIDDYVLSQLRMLRQEHFLARKLLQLQALLWPGGSWFMTAAWHAVSALTSASSGIA